MKYKVEFVAFQSAIMAPGVVGSEVTLAKSTKYKEVEMEFHTEGYLIIQVNKTSKPILVPAMNIKSMVLGDFVQGPKKAV